ncbi:MAG: hypothetical protein ACJASX_000704 [Limisphaerales bacterium]
MKFAISRIFIAASVRKTCQFPSIDQHVVARLRATDHNLFKHPKGHLPTYRETNQVMLHAVREGRWKYNPKPTKFLGLGTDEYLKIPESALYDLNADPGRRGTSGRRTGW